MSTESQSAASQIVVLPDKALRTLAVLPGVFSVVTLLILFGSGSAAIQDPYAKAGLLTTAVVLAVLFWGATRLRIRVAKTSAQEIVVHAPLYRRSFTGSQVSNVTVCVDDGANQGLLNWPVTGRTESVQGVRLNVGGSAHVAFTVEGIGSMTIVAQDEKQAQSIAALLQS
ncbi:hypothetical protein AUR04nite_19070 [Glutamicibacter uratoxydans]|uniref:DUF3093 domain-containing protein n=1 Tax=Glutamicibacter uratoxydans TaxID=43667 RepID=A0A4Y4DRY9_GLUUR|nr:hypothetical protein [Glutamicibacter uratoxydans]GED06375.1 hypothetical protein AUR04nite_19070 [Glutamicibacter uratoxydans]